MRKLQLPADRTFVDLGAGKGRVILLAIDAGFKKVVGIEFSDPLCRIARENVERFRKARRSPDVRVQIVHSDVVQYRIQPDECVFFMFDPFNAPVLKQTLENMRLSVGAMPRQIWLIYHTPREHRIVADSKLFSTHERHVIGGTEFMVYSNRDAGGSNH